MGLHRIEHLTREYTLPYLLQKLFIILIFFPFYFQTLAAETYKSTPLIEPTQFYLSNSNDLSSILHISNNDSFPIEWHAEVFAWSQDASGKDNLEPTSDILIEPTSFHLYPRKQGSIRKQRSTRLLMTMVFR